MTSLEDLVVIPRKIKYQSINSKSSFKVYIAICFVFNCLKLEVIVSFVDIGENVDHHCLEVIVSFIIPHEY
jgi:hypothetical protein